MSSDDGNDYHKNRQQQSITPTPSSVSVSTVNTNTIRRKSLTQVHFPHQLQTQAINISCNGGSSSKDRGDRIEIVERGCSGEQLTTVSGYGGHGGQSSSPSRYIQSDDGYHTINGRISACPSERYEENITCCLPPPSPAPTSDRFVIGE